MQKLTVQKQYKHINKNKGNKWLWVAQLKRDKVMWPKALSNG